MVPKKYDFKEMFLLLEWNKFHFLPKSYNCLSWTKIKDTSVLVAAGKHGQIKIILPKYSACLARIDAHKGHINQLVFHHKYPNILLSKIKKKIKYLHDEYDLFAKIKRCIWWSKY